MAERIGWQAYKAAHAATGKIQQLEAQIFALSKGQAKPEQAKVSYSTIASPATLLVFPFSSGKNRGRYRNGYL